MHLLTYAGINNKGMSADHGFEALLYSCASCAARSAALSHRGELEQLTQMGRLRGMEGHPNLLLA